MDDKDLKRLIKNAKARVKVGMKYAHFKDPKHTYIVLDIAVNQNYEIVVIYKALYGEHLTWTRPIDEFTGKVLKKDEKVKRFTLIGQS